MSPWLLISILLVLTAPGQAQILEFWSNGLPYQALTRGGFTLMYARMPLAIRSYGVLQVAVNNGSNQVWKIKPLDLVFEPDEGPPVRAVSENEVVYDLFRHAGRTEVVKLQTAFS